NLWRIAGKVFLVALVLDGIYQITVLHGIYPLQALIVATLLALVPCMIVRAIGNRIVSLARRKQSMVDKEVSRVASNDITGTPENAHHQDNTDRRRAIVQAGSRSSGSSVRSAASDPCQPGTRCHGLCLSGRSSLRSM